MRHRAIAVALLLLAGACGADDDDVADDACPALDPDDPVTLRVPYGDHELAREWDAEEPGVVLDLRDGEPPMQMALTMTGDDPHALTSGPSWMTGVIEDVGAVTTSATCFESTRLYDGAWLMAYDRNAFERAGLDPDAPPQTFDELHEAGIALRERAGIDTPISWLPVPVAFFELDVRTEETERAARAWTRLGTDGLLHVPNDDLPPLGSGEAAIQILFNEELWLYADAIADGQAPDADIGVALVPGVDGPQSTFEHFEWVIATGASLEEQVAATAFLSWLGEPAQQLRIHRQHGLIPARGDVVETDGFVSYWEERPLLRTMWEVLQTMPPSQADAPDGGSVDWLTLTETLRAVATGELDFDAAWTDLLLLDELARAAHEKDPIGLLRCLAATPSWEGSALAGCV